MDFEDYEGFKRIKNSKHLTAEQLVDVLREYEKILGEISYRFGLVDADIFIDFKGKYGAEVRINEETDEIIVERKLDEGYIADADTVDLENDIDISEAKANRLIEQIYDLINDYMDDGIITEHITECQKVLYMEENDEIFLNTGVPIGNNFEITDETNKLIYSAKENLLTKKYTLTDISSDRIEFSIDYSNYNNYVYSMTATQPFENITFRKDNTTIKTRFLSNSDTKQYKISGDFTDNHYLIELNEVVIGAIDCLDSRMKTQYKIEVNNLDEIKKIMAIAVMIDVYLRKEESIQFKKEVIEKVKSTLKSKNNKKQ